MEKKEFQEMDMAIKERRRLMREKDRILSEEKYRAEGWKPLSQFASDNYFHSGGVGKPMWDDD